MATMEHPERPVVFISYSHADQKWLDELLTQLKPLMDRSLLDCWSDKEISAGDHWRQEIEQALCSVKVAILLVSPEFLASDFIAKNELPTLLKSANQGDMKLLWIPVGANNYKHTELAEFQATHPPEKPLNSLRKAARQKALVAISDKIFEAVGVGTAAGRPAMPSDDRVQAMSARPGAKHQRPDGKLASAHLVVKITKLVMTLIAAIGIILVGFWLSWTLSPVEGERRFTGRVVERVSQKKLQGAKVSLEAQGVPPILYTDSEGVFSFSLPPKVQELRLVIEVSGYEPYDRRVAVSSISNVEDIRLERSPGEPNEAATTAEPEERPQATQDANDILGTWHWATYPDGRTMWVTVHSDGTLDSTIYTVHSDGTRSEEVNNTGRWSVAGKSPLRFELHWNSTSGNYVVTNFVTLSPDGRDLLENDKGQEVIRGTRALP